MIRTFIALDTPESVKHWIQAAARKLSAVSRDKVSWARPEGIHLTLKFLGDVAESDLPAIYEAVQACAANSHPLNLSTAQIGGFPNLKKPRVLWLGLTPDAGLLKLQQELELKLAELGYPPEDKPFHPHLTAARIKFLERDSRLPEAFGKLEPPFVKWTAHSVKVMASELRPTGAVYTTMFEAELGA